MAVYRVVGCTGTASDSQSRWHGVCRPLSALYTPLVFSVYFYTQLGVVKRSVYMLAGAGVYKKAGRKPVSPVPVLPLTAAIPCPQATRAASSTLWCTP